VLFFSGHRRKSRPAAMSLLRGLPGGKIDKLLNLSGLVLHHPVR
jgi:hypothetical protein